MALIKHGNNALSSVTAFPSAVPTGKPVLLSTATASGSASIEFTSGIDSSYDIYQFEFNSIHPSVVSPNFDFNLSTDSGSNYNVAKTTTIFRSYHNESDTDSGLQYRADMDLANGTGYQRIIMSTGTDNDQSCSGSFQLFNPSSHTYIKHFLSIMNDYAFNDYSNQTFVGGYANTINPINAVSFKFSSGNIDAGTIKMYGISAWV